MMKSMATRNVHTTNSFGIDLGRTKYLGIEWGHVFLGPARARPSRECEDDENGFEI